MREMGSRAEVVVVTGPRLGGRRHGVLDLGAFDTCSTLSIQD
jgi:hypothetical protein